MSKINLTHNGIDYTLEYDRYSIKVIENNGFELDKFGKQPLSMVDLAFAGAFIKHHRKTKQTVIDEIYKNCKNKEALIENLTTMIADCYTTLTDEPEGDEGNVEWEVVA